MPETLQSQQTLEKTPSYMITRGVPERIRSLDPHMKLLVVVRNPVTRAISDYSQKLFKHNLASRGDPIQSVLLPFESFAFRTIPLVNSTNPGPNMQISSAAGSEQRSVPRSIGTTQMRLVNTTWRAIKLGLYYKHVRRWLKSFPLKQMHFVSGERLITHPSQEVNLVERFLDLKPVITSKHFYFNTSKGFPCLKKSPGNSEPHCLGQTKGRTHPMVPKWAIDALDTFYRPYNRLFYKLVGRDFHW